MCVACASLSRPRCHDRTRATLYPAEHRCRWRPALEAQACHGVEVVLVEHDAEDVAEGVDDDAGEADVWTLARLAAPTPLDLIGNLAGRGGLVHVLDQPEVVRLLLQIATELTCRYRDEGSVIPDGRYEAEGVAGDRHVADGRER